MILLGDNPKRAVPAVCLNYEAEPAKCELGADILARPEKLPTLDERNAANALDSAAKSPESGGRNSEADTFVVFLGLHGREMPNSMRLSDRIVVNQVHGFRL